MGVFHLINLELRGNVEVHLLHNRTYSFWFLRVACGGTLLIDTKLKIRSLLCRTLVTIILAVGFVTHITPFCLPSMDVKGHVGLQRGNPVGWVFRGTQISNKLYH